jgi:hypothetical protein
VVNSIAHIWGYRNDTTDESSRNNVLVGYFSNGEGWHNDHHADPRSAKFGHRWWEVDTTYLTHPAPRQARRPRDVVMSNPRLVATAAGKALKTHHYQEVPGDGATPERH